MLFGLGIYPPCKKLLSVCHKCSYNQAFLCSDLVWGTLLFLIKWHLFTGSASLPRYSLSSRRRKTPIILRQPRFQSASSSAANNISYPSPYVEKPVYGFPIMRNQAHSTQTAAHFIISEKQKKTSGGLRIHRALIHVYSSVAGADLEASTGQ